ncbi:MAG: ABC transporter ATP-binding protein [Caulobacteraceae bacterium]|nr:ABC transporter ATP-binding protein [Caulobacteraceae bacterium]
MAGARLTSALTLKRLLARHGRSGDETTPALDAATTAPGLNVRGLSFRYGQQTLFEDLDLTLAGGEFVVLLGASGVGKTSLLKIIAGLEQPSAGVVEASDGRPLRRRIAYMAQQDLLYPWLDVLQNVMLGSRLRGEAGDADRAHELLTRVGLGDRAEALPAQLSGGMRQRAAIARTLYEDRPIVLMDEPFSALDAITRARIQDLAAELLRGRTTLLITHDPLEACRLGHRLFVLLGHPARLGPAITVRGETPRAPDDEDLLHTQGRLMRTLTQQEERDPA